MHYQQRRAFINGHTATQRRVARPKAWTITEETGGDAHRHMNLPEIGPNEYCLLLVFVDSDSVTQTLDGWTSLSSHRVSGMAHSAELWGKPVGVGETIANVIAAGVVGCFARSFPVQNRKIEFGPFF